MVVKVVIDRESQTDAGDDDKSTNTREELGKVV